MNDFEYAYDEVAATVAGDSVPIIRRRSTVTFTSSDGESGRGEEMLGLLERPEWWARAACVGMNPSLFFPERGDCVPPVVREVCGGCPAKVECLEAALARGEKYGIFGGLTERQRRAIRRQRNGAAA